MPFSDSKLDTSWSFYQSSLSISFFQAYLDKKKVELETVEVNNINLLSKPGFIFNYLCVCLKCWRMIKNSFTKPNQFAVEEELQLFILLKKAPGQMLS